MMEPSVGDKTNQANISKRRENMTDLPDVAKLPTGWASDGRVNHAWFLFLSAHIYKYFVLLPISTDSLIII